MGYFGALIVGLFVIGLYFAFLWRWWVLVSFTILFSGLVITLGFCCILGCRSLGGVWYLWVTLFGFFPFDGDLGRVGFN